MSTKTSNSSRQSFAAFEALESRELMSVTPAAVPALKNYKGTLLSYSKPASWTATQSSSGISIQSPDKTVQVGVIGQLSSQGVTLASIASAEKNAGATIVYAKVLSSKSTATLAFQSGAALVTFESKGVEYVGAELVEIYTLPKKGVSLTEIYEAVAPKSQFVADAPTMLSVLKSIKPTKSLTSVTTPPKGSKSIGFTNPGLSVPGTKTTSKSKGLFNSYYSDYYATQETELLLAETQAQQAASDASFNEFDAELRS